MFYSAPWLYFTMLFMFILLSIGPFPEDVLMYHVPPSTLFAPNGSLVVLFYIFAFKDADATVIGNTVPDTRNTYVYTTVQLLRISVAPVTVDQEIVTLVLEKYNIFFPPPKFEGTKVSTQVLIIGLLQLTHMHICVS